MKVLINLFVQDKFLDTIFLRIGRVLPLSTSLKRGSNYNYIFENEFFTTKQNSIIHEQFFRFVNSTIFSLNLYINIHKIIQNFICIKF
jgi:hypothetical protein